MILIATGITQQMRHSHQCIVIMAIGLQLHSAIVAGCAILHQGIEESVEVLKSLVLLNPIECLVSDAVITGIKRKCYIVPSTSWL